MQDDGRGEAESSSVLPRHLHPSIIQKLSREASYSILIELCDDHGFNYRSLPHILRVVGRILKSSC